MPPRRPLDSARVDAAAKRMPPDHESAHEHTLKHLDHSALRFLALRRLQGLLRGFDTTEVENAAQDVMLAFTLCVRRDGVRRSPEALVLTIARNVAADMIAARVHEQRVTTELAHEYRVTHIDQAQEAEVVEAVHRMVFIVTEYLRLRRARCLPLVEAKQHGESLKAFAQRHGLAHAKVLQDWSRCARFVLDAIRRGRLRLDWPRPSGKRRRGE